MVLLDLLLILIALYCPWLLPVLVVAFMIYCISPILLGILVGGIVIVCIVALVYALLEDKKQKERYSRKRKENR